MPLPRAAPNQHQSEQDLGSRYKIGGHMGLQIRLLNAGNSAKSFAAFAALERGRQHENALEVSQNHCTFIGEALPRFVSIQNDSGLPQGPAHLSPGRLLMHQTACARRP
jgi:hypothetical protein